MKGFEKKSLLRTVPEIRKKEPKRLIYTSRWLSIVSEIVS